MINLSKKLYISLFTLLLLVVVAGTATFAWFKLNTNAWFDDMELNVNSQDGIKISVDGVNFKNQLNEKDLKVAILAKAYGYDVATVDGELCYKSLNNSGNYEYYSTYSYEEDFSKLITLEPVTSTDGCNFKNLYNQEKLLSTGEFINLDIYFKGDDESTRNIYFSNSEKKYDDTIIPKTEILVKNQDYISFPLNLSGSFTTFNPDTGESYFYDKALDNRPDFEFRTLASDAVRFSVKTYSGNNIDKSYRIYEINEGIGSYATDYSEEYYVGLTGAKYDCSKNAAFTYFNNVRGYETGDILDELPFEYMPYTYKGFDTLEGALVAQLNESNHYGATGDVKLNMYLWIEGWDADCIDSIWDQYIQVKMSFTGFEVQEETIELTYQVTNPLTGEVMSERTVHQIQGEIISDQTPAKDIYSGLKYKFKCWGKVNEDGLIEPYDFSEPAWLDAYETPNWKFVTIWEK